MRDGKRFLWLIIGVVIGGVATAVFFSQGRLAQAGNDRFEDYIMCTGAVSIEPKAQTDGVWLLDYRSGKLLGTVIDRRVGKIIGWAEVDLVDEFKVKPQSNVHFMMTTGSIAQGQAALYVAEISTGKFGVYTMSPRADNQPGVSIRRHDMVPFRQPPQRADGK